MRTLGINKAVVVMLAVLGMMPMMAHAQTKIAVLDVAEVMANTNAAKRAAESLEGRMNTAQKQISALEKPLLEKQKQLRDQASVMAPDKAKAAQADFGKELGEFRRKVQEINGQLDAENVKLRNRIADGVKSVVTEIAKERAYDVVLPKTMALYTSEAVPDITADVLKRANALLDK